MRLRLTILAFLIAGVPAWADEKPDYWRDIFGRPLPFGKAVDGYQIGVRLPTTRLVYGQPLCVWAVHYSARDMEPYLRVNWTGDERNTTLRLTTDRGETVQFTLTEQGAHDLMVQPDGKFTHGRCLKPGKYRLQAVFESKWSSRDPVGWVGKLESNAVEFEVLEFGSPKPELLPAAIRGPATKAIADLNDSNFKVREAAAKELAKIGLETLPVIEDALGAKSAEVREVANKLFRDILKPEMEREIPLFDGDQLPFLMSTFSDTGWRVFGKLFGEDYERAYRFHAAPYCPLRPVPDRDPLPADVVKELVAQLGHEQPHVRRTALRRVPRTSNPELLGALVQCLSDPYQVAGGNLDIALFNVIADEAGRNAIPAQGKAAIGPLIDYFKKVDDPTVKFRIVEALSRLGPDQRSLATIRGYLRNTEDGDYRVTEFLCEMGRDAVSELLSLVDKSPNPAVRAEALHGLGRHADGKTARDTVLQALKSEDDQVARAAADAASDLRMKDALLVLRRIATDEKRDQNVRNSALQAFALTAERDDSVDFLLELLKSNSRSVQGHAIQMLGETQATSSVPVLLRLLDDRDSFTRYHADLALRAIAHKPEGVGFNEEKPEPRLWREYWKSRK